MPATLTAPVRPTAAPADGWDSRVVIITGDDRGHLGERVRDLAASLDDGGDLPGLAADLAAELAPGGVRLAVVAADAADCAAKLRRAAGRLADPGCRRIHDAAGVYFADEPLYPGGSVALLFPGEGSQYTGMLADLCGVLPEVGETFAWCDRLAAEAGRPSIRPVLHPSPAEWDAAEVELRKVGPSLLGVLIADLAVGEVLKSLRVPAAAVAGHSGGELAALLFAGAIGPDAGLGPQLVGAVELVQSQEDAAGGPDVLLLAVGAGRALVEGVAREAGGGTVAVAMDNCPHQCVVVGPAAGVAAVEKALLGRGVVCERLPFRRPYHTPLFEPWMGPFRDQFGRVPFRPPHTPVYSCSTGEPFPADSLEARDTAVGQWVRPVEFARTVENLYADGVRIFVEAGPRGVLSAFVEDVLRGRPFAAVPANPPRKSGPTGVNHLVARLAAHHVPLDLTPLFGGRPVARTRA